MLSKNIHIFVLIFYGINVVTTINDTENVSEQISKYDELFRNDSIEVVDFNESIGLFNVSNSSIMSNLTDDYNSSSPDLVITEDESLDSSQTFLSFSTSNDDVCSCDLNSNVCDINCCCDSDCSEEDIKVFSECHVQTLTPDPNYCYQKDIIFRNNTIYKMQKDPESSLFCIVHDNLKQHLRFKELPVIKSHRDLDLLLKYQSRNIASWSEDENRGKSSHQEMKSGNPVYIDFVTEKFKSFDTHWSLPSPCFTRMCSCNQEIKYLEDFNSVCSTNT
ncbi:hypothetical protein CEXT_113981 [Caerostris extrusa]|uniref:Tectonic-1-3 N-terminal domain-containing protein n=1 Tax=Caerostris extrusa TaxID=172846 RepID=A0AAV4RFW2_CAEEX|nr:hypothetical protein CEXT_113981 [Caerostris extrusa]